MVVRIIKGILATGVSVDTQITDTHVQPGGKLRGDVCFNGGDVEQKVEGITLEFTALVEQDSKGEGRTTTQHFFRAQVSGPFQLGPGTEHTVPFEILVPWETPFNAVSGRPLKGMKLGVATELALDMAFDKSDLDPLTVEPIGVQAEAMRAVESMGFLLQGADLEEGTIAGSHMPFYQEVEYWPNGEFADRFDELELTFVTNATSTDIILQDGAPGGLLAPGNDVYQRMTVPNDSTDDLTDPIRTQLQQLAQRRG